MSEPGELFFTANPAGSFPPYLSSSQQVTFTATGDMSEGIQIQAFGMSPPVLLPGQSITQDDPSNYCSAKWIYKKDEGGLKILNGGLLEITTTAADPHLDVDLYLFQDNGDKKWSCAQDSLVAYSISSGIPDERIKINFPEDGIYWVVAHGNQVVGSQKTFDIQIRSISGTDMTLENIPVGPIRANQPVSFTVNYHGKYPFRTPTVLEGFLLIGTPSMPYLIEVPVRSQPTIYIYPAPVFWSSSRWVAKTPVTFKLTVQNLGANPENVRTRIQLPEGLVYASGSANGPGEILYDSNARSLSWSSMIGDSKTVTLVFQVTAQPGAPSKRAEILAEVNGDISGQKWSVSLPVWINQYGLLFPLISR